MPTPRVSVLMTVYNGLPYLQPAVESVLAQTYKDFYFVIVNDGSNDATADYLNSLTDPRIQLIHRENGGTAVAANHGLTQCNTELIARFDADDICLPDRFEKQIAFLDANPEVGILGTQMAPMGAIGVGASLQLPTEHEEIYSTLLDGRHAMGHATLMMRTELLKGIGGYWAEPLVDDWDMMLRMGEVSKLANLPEVFHHYRIHSGSLNGSKMRWLREGVDFSCELARRRQAGSPSLSLEEFRAARRSRPWLERTLESIEIHARAQYRVALAEIYGGKAARGYTRMAWAASCSPQLTCERIVRSLRAAVSPAFASRA